jgi:hypothetical protein
VESHHHVHVFQEIAAPRAGNADVVGCTERASQPGRICRNVIDVDETPIKITVADTVIMARLADNATARDLAAQLPTLTFKDFNHVEKVATLPRRLSTDSAPAGADPDIGDIGYYAPLGNLGVLLQRRRLLEWHRSHRPIRHHDGGDRAPRRQLPGHDRTQLITRGGRDDRRTVQREAAAISS